jgi:hypothetical protein
MLLDFWEEMNLNARLSDQREEVSGDEPQDQANNDEDESVLDKGVAGHVVTSCSVRSPRILTDCPAQEN